MFPSDVEALARSIVPGGGAVSLRRLSTGLLNSTYRAVRDGAEYALRVPVDRAPNAPDWTWETRVLEQAGRKGLAPPLVYADEQSGALVLGWVRGGTWCEEEARSLETTDKMARLLRAIHALPTPAKPRCMEPADWVDRYSQALSSQTLSATAALAECAARAIRSLRALPQPTASVVCHSDLHRLNVVQRDADTDGNGLLLLDWEYAHVTDGYWDLAGWSANNDLPEDTQRHLLRSYGGLLPTEQQWARFKLLCWLYDYICLLWIELYVRTRPAESAPIALRAAWLERRLRLSVYGTITG